MKRILVLVVAYFLFFATSCKKEKNTHCHECQLDYFNQSNYTDVGCQNDEDWNNRVVTDNIGNILDKSTDCRTK